MPGLDPIKMREAELEIFEEMREVVAPLIELDVFFYLSNQHVAEWLGNRGYEVDAITCGDFRLWVAADLAPSGRKVG